jgi:hypothetical protein
MRLPPMAACMGTSKINYYETPCDITGIAKPGSLRNLFRRVVEYTGSKVSPKGIYAKPCSTRLVIGISERGKPETYENKPLRVRWAGKSQDITALNSGESCAATDEVAVMAMEEQAQVDFDRKTKTSNP